MKGERLMDHLLQAMHLDGFERLLEAYSEAGVDLGCAIDGGAGSGTTANQMLEHLPADAVIYAYEPFPGNHRFFEGCSQQIKLMKRALADKSSEMTLAVSAVVPDDSDWGKRGLTGYSSAGHLVQGSPTHEHDTVVESVRADEDIPPTARIGFVKLDLQGGELNALKGMSDFLRADVVFMWIEYMFSAGTAPRDLHAHLVQNDFLLFDTEYLFRGTPSDEAKDYFEVSRTGELSNGAAVWYGFKRLPWNDFFAESARFAEDFSLIQTDLCCINRKYLDDFLSALPFLKQ